LALKGSNEVVQQKIFKNMSQRAASMLKEEIDYLGPVRLRDVEEAQQRIVAIIRKLEDAGEVVISRGGEDEIIV
jgi:flagellar motor switch protein FliG